MAITFDEVSLDVFEPVPLGPGAAAAPTAPAPAGGPEIAQRLEQLLRERSERALRLLAD